MGYFWFFENIWVTWCLGWMRVLLVLLKTVIMLEVIFVILQQLGWLRYGLVFTEICWMALSAGSDPKKAKFRACQEVCYCSFFYSHQKGFTLGCYDLTLSGRFFYLLNSPQVFSYWTCVHNLLFLFWTSHFCNWPLCIILGIFISLYRNYLNICIKYPLVSRNDPLLLLLFDHYSPVSVDVVYDCHVWLLLCLSWQ